jgi:hypothetical protein
MNKKQTNEPFVVYFIVQHDGWMMVMVNLCLCEENCASHKPKIFYKPYSNFVTHLCMHSVLTITVF